MHFRLTFDELSALQWLGGWYARFRASRGRWEHRFGSRYGVEAIADLVPPTALRFARPTARGGARGPQRPSVHPLDVNERVRVPLSALATVLGYSRPQEAVIAIAQEIVRRAPGVTIDCDGEANFAAISALVAEIEDAIQAALRETDGEATKCAT